PSAWCPSAPWLSILTSCSAALAATEASKAETATAKMARVFFMTKPSIWLDRHRARERCWNWGPIATRPGSGCYETDRIAALFVRALHTKHRNRQTASRDL